MKITQVAIDAMPTGSKVRKRLAYELDVHPTSVDRWIEDNEDESKLTTVKALEVIEEETGLPLDKILDKEEKTA